MNYGPRRKMLMFSLGVMRMDRIRKVRGTVHVGRFGNKVRKAERDGLDLYGGGRRRRRV